jgi:hypothetical protein
MNDNNSPILLMILTALLDIAKINPYLTAMSAVVAIVFGTIRIVKEIRDWKKK